MHDLAKMAVLAALILSPSAIAQTPPSGSLRADTPADYAPHASNGKTFNEFWTYQFLLNGGIQVQLNLSRANFGSFKDHVCGADLAVMNFMGRNSFVAREYPVKRFSWTPGSARLEVHDDIWSEGQPPRAHRIFFATEKGGKKYFVDLTFENMMPGAVWGDGVFDLADNQKMALYFHIPRARVKGRVEGGYFFQKGDKVFGYGVREDKGRLTLLQPTAVTAASRAAWGGTQVPKRLEVSL